MRQRCAKHSLPWLRQRGQSEGIGRGTSRHKVNAGLGRLEQGADMIAHPFHQRLRIQGQARYEVLGDLQYLQLGVGGQLMVGDPHPGEVGGP